MKIFDRNGKLNFVDENNVFVGFDMGASCCEDFGTFFSKVELESIDYSSVDRDSQYALVEGTNYVFDPSYIKEYGEAAGFKLVDPDGVNEALYLYIFNFHNGYYSHGFYFCNGETVIKGGYL